MKHGQRSRGLVWLAALGMGAAAGCTMSFPNANEDGKYACKTSSDCISGYECVEGFCTAHGGGGGDDNGGGGDNLPPTDQAGERYTLSVSRSGVGVGTVTSNPTGISCGTTCQFDFLENTVVNLAAAPEMGSRFASWQGACTGLGVCSVTMIADRTVTAEFMLDTARPVVNVLSGAGTVTGGNMRLDFQVGGGVEARRVTDTTNRTLEAGPGLQPRQQR